VTLALEIASLACGITVVRTRDAHYTPGMQLNGGLTTCTLLVATLMLPVATSADPLLSVLIEPDDYAVGTDLSHAFPGITLSTFSNRNPGGLFHYLPVTVVQDASCIVQPIGPCRAFSGTHLLGEPGSGNDHTGLLAIAGCFTIAAVRSGSAPCTEDYGRIYNVDAPLLVSVAEPTNFVEISGTWIHDEIWSFAFDANFNLLGRGDPRFVIEYDEHGSAPEFRRNTTTFRTDAPEISYVLAGSWDGLGWLDTVRIGEPETVASVPEPGTVTFIALGLGAGMSIRWTHRRRGRRSGFASLGRGRVVDETRLRLEEGVLTDAIKTQPDCGCHSSDPCLR
jgi:hypothetical protein